MTDFTVFFFILKVWWNDQFSFVVFQQCNFWEKSASGFAYFALYSSKRCGIISLILRHSLICVLIYIVVYRCWCDVKNNGNISDVPTLYRFVLYVVRLLRKSLVAIKILEKKLFEHYAWLNSATTTVRLLQCINFALLWGCCDNYIASRPTT